jgi:predicted lipoprotein
MISNSDRMTLRDAWALRNAAALTLIRTEELIKQQLQAATVADIVGLLDAFSPARSPGPDWTRSLDALTERLWAWCDAKTLAAVKAELDARGAAWSPIGNALEPAHGEHLRAALRPAAQGSRLPRFSLA